MKALTDKQRKIVEVVRGGLESCRKSGRVLSAGTWGSSCSDGTVCLVGAIGTKYATEETGNIELRPDCVAPLITNGAAGIVDDLVLGALSAGFEKYHQKYSDGWTDAITYGWAMWADDEKAILERVVTGGQELEDTYEFCYELGMRIREMDDSCRPLNELISFLDSVLAKGHFS